MMFLFLAVIMLGALFFWGVEGYNECLQAGLPFPEGIVKWSYGDSIYFMVITLTTIGYGDLSPSTPGGKVFVIFFGAIGLAIVAATLGYFTSVLVDALRSSKQILAPYLIRRGCAPKVASFVSDWRLAIIISMIYLFLLVIGSVLFGWSEPFEGPMVRNALVPHPFVSLTFFFLFSF